MSDSPTILITGAKGNLGDKLRRHLRDRFPLRLIDRDARGDPAIIEADLSRWDSRWAKQFDGVHVIVHLAADATAQQSWPALIAPNLDATINVYRAAASSAVPRFIFASSNHVLGGYKDRAEPELLTADTDPFPGAEYVVSGEPRNSRAYGATKLFGERLGKCFAEIDGRTVIALRIGWVRHGGNRAEDIPGDREDWFRLMWLSDRDYCQLMERCITATVPCGFHILNGMSANTGMRWDLSGAKALVNYQPRDDITQG
jgi:uronate dehydrogenase